MIKQFFRIGIGVLMGFLVMVPGVLAQEKLHVVATNSLIGDWVKNVTGDQVKLTILVGENADAHTFEPTPQDSIVLKNADIIFEMGESFERWLTDLYVASQSKARRVEFFSALDGLEIREEENPLAHVDHNHDIDPHVWHDVAHVIRMVERIRAELVSSDLANREIYKVRAASYVQELVELDQWIVQEVARLEPAMRLLVTSHDTFAYFAQRYGFAVVGTSIDSATTEAADPSAQEIARLIDKIRSHKIRAIFAENIKDSSVMEAIARETGATLAPKLYTDALGEVGSEGETYLKMMRYNVKTIIQALNPYGLKFSL